MRRKRYTAVLGSMTLLLVLGLCFMSTGSASTVNGNPDASVESPAIAQAAPAVPAAVPAVSKPAAQAAAAPARAVPPRRTTSTSRPSATVEDETTVESDDPAVESPDAVEDESSGSDTISAAGWTSGAPNNFKVTYTVSNHTATCTWDKVTSPAPHDYRVYKWSKSVYSTVSSIYQQLAALDATALPYYNDWKNRMDTMISLTPGLTFTERQAALDVIQVDADALNGIICTNPAAASLLTQLMNAAVKRQNNGTSTTWADTGCTNNNYYWYAVVTRNGSHVVTSPFSHTDYTFTVRNNSTKPAVPTGFTATAYDPGVVLSWARNQEYDLAGYNVYRISGSTWTKLNTTGLITVGTEYYYAAGTAGQKFGITAVDTSSPARESSKTTNATAVLAPATVYLATDPGWVTSGTWRLENYTPDGGKELLVANDTGSRASHAFCGRRVKVTVSTYWSCGTVRFLIDGVDYGTFDLNSPATAWNVVAFTASGLAAGNHTFSFEATGAGGVEDLHFVNVQSIEVR